MKERCLSIQAIQELKRIVGFHFSVYCKQTRSTFTAKILRDPQMSCLSIKCLSCF